ncbi:MAG: SAM-dependent methyltransferase [Steroidobacteraceae bacterium]
MSAPDDPGPLSPAERAHGEAVAARVRAEIDAAGGWIGFDRYMELVLYAPGLGYYSAGARKFGAAGDFVTAPEVAPVFSRCMAAQCAEVLAGLGGGDVLEIGAGSGAMAAAMLAEFEALGALPAHYRILDVSADLRDRQRATIEAAVPHLAGRVEWLDRLPDAFVGVAVANEVIDALPVERFAWRGGAALELGVVADGAGFRTDARPAPPPLAATVAHLRATCGADWPDGYVSESCNRLAPWIAALAASLGRGVLLFVDYGLPRHEYYAAGRSAGTLACHFRHRFHDDPYARPGLEDITAWVDFTAVAEAADAAGLMVAGYTTQAHFLIGNGLDRRLREVSDLDLVSRLNLSRQAMLLTLPGEMGERFKAIALSKGYDAPLAGFAVRDLRHTL